MVFKLSSVLARIVATVFQLDLELNMANARATQVHSYVARKWLDMFGLASAVCASATADYQEAIEHYRRIYADNYDDTEKPKIVCTAGMDGAWMY